MTMTLSAGAAEDIGGVIAAIADLLKIAVPPSYEIDQSEKPSDYAMAKAGKRRCTEDDIVRFMMCSGIRVYGHLASKVTSLLRSPLLRPK